MKDEVSEYERLRLENIRQNELELEKLGLMLPKLTQPAPFKSSKRRRLRKTNTTNRKPNFLDITNEVPIPLRRSSRVSALNIRAAPAIDKVVSKGKYELYNNEQSKRLNYNHKPNSKRKYPTGSNSHKREPNLNMKPSSIKNIDVAVAKLQSHIGNIISPMGGQVKRAVMELGSQTSCSITPTFSRMSGIQEWKNCIFLFVNVYGDDYKNVFLDGGRRITWFAQSRQNEETPVVQRMIYMCGGGRRITWFAQSRQNEGSKMTVLLVFFRISFFLIFFNASLNESFKRRLSYKE
mmetsp:Transcript_18029/g.22180  ORF Transcript_18029/g.22180 Transcript_18029/m.22180 type:complete len:293 (-) Transcript_18029:1386-2264(-)